MSHSIDCIFNIHIYIEFHALITKYRVILVRNHMCAATCNSKLKYAIENMCSIHKLYHQNRFQRVFSTMIRRFLENVERNHHVFSCNYATIWLPIIRASLKLIAKLHIVWHWNGAISLTESAYLPIECAKKNKIKENSTNCFINYITKVYRQKKN